ncbi:MAG: GNAT family N-acetyltransferase [Arachnia sp.]
MPSSVRLATAHDLALVADIEAAADVAFEGVFDSSDWGTPPSGEERLAHPGFVLVVTESEEGPPVGFAHVIAHGSTAHLEQVSVHPDHGRRGHGRALVEAAAAEAARRGFTLMTLRTFADVPWNAPFYATLGFVERPTPDDDFHRELAAAEHRLGLDRQGRRVHMELSLTP